LYVGVQFLDLSGIIGIVVAVSLLDRFAANYILARRMDVTRKDLHLFSGVGFTALSALISGAVLYGFYLVCREFLLNLCTTISREVLSTIGLERLTEFCSGALFIAICLAVYLPVYLFVANWLGVIATADKERIMIAFRKLRLVK
jgi:hypothetical protein